MRIIFIECGKVIIAAVVAAVSFLIDHLRRDIPLAYNWWSATGSMFPY